MAELVIDSLQESRDIGTCAGCKHRAYPDLLWSACKIMTSRYPEVAGMSMLIHITVDGIPLGHQKNKHYIDVRTHKNFTCAEWEQANGT